MKTCLKCGCLLDLSLFSKDSSKRDGLYPSCKSCSSKYRKEFYLNNKAELNKKNTERQRKNIEQTRARKLRYSRSAKGKAAQQKYKSLNKKSYKPLTQDQKDKKKIAQKKYYSNNIALIREKAKIYNKTRKVSKEKRKEYKKREYIKMMNSPEKRLTHLLRTRLRDSIKLGINIKTSEYISYTPVELKNHLERLWLQGMTWENYGRDGWHIDHIRPCASFDMTNPDEIKKCWSLENLRPLWALENLVKGAKW